MPGGCFRTLDEDLQQRLVAAMACHGDQEIQRPQQLIRGRLKEQCEVLLRQTIKLRVRADSLSPAAGDGPGKCDFEFAPFPCAVGFGNVTHLPIEQAAHFLHGICCPFQATAQAGGEFNRHQSCQPVVDM